MFVVYMPTFSRIHAGLTPSQAVWSNTIGLACIAALVPVAGWLSDRYGRKPFLLSSCVLVLFLAVPAFWIVMTAKSFGATIAVQVALACTIALYSGAGPATMAERFPTAGRSRWIAVPYALATAIFGGFAPFVAAWLTKATHQPLAPALYVIGAAAISLIAILQMPETAGTELD